MNKNKIVIASPHSFLYDIILSEIEADLCDIILLQNDEQIKSLIKDISKIDILINDMDTKLMQDLAVFSKYVFSFNDFPIRHSIFYKKPIILRSLVNEIKQSLVNKKQFSILDDVIYDERHSEFIIDRKNIFKLTNMENKVFSSLLSAENFFVTNDFLLQNVWKYSSAVDTDTVKTHMNKLRSLLPNGLISFVGDGYKLNVEKILK